MPLTPESQSYQEMKTQSVTWAQPKGRKEREGPADRMMV